MLEFERGTDMETQSLFLSKLIFAGTYVLFTGISTGACRLKEAMYVGSHVIYTIITLKLKILKAQLVDIRH
jgi:hypothetical protein